MKRTASITQRKMVILDVKKLQDWLQNSAILHQFIESVSLLLESRLVLWHVLTYYWRRKWQLTPVFLPGESHEWRSLVGYSPRVAKSRTWLSDFTSLFTLGVTQMTISEGSFPERCYNLPLTFIAAYVTVRKCSRGLPVFQTCFLTQCCGSVPSSLW